MIHEIQAPCSPIQPANRATAEASAQTEISGSIVAAANAGTTVELLAENSALLARCKQKFEQVNEGLRELRAIGTEEPARMALACREDDFVAPEQGRGAHETGEVAGDESSDDSISDAQAVGQSVGYVNTGAGIREVTIGNHWDSDIVV